VPAVRDLGVFIDHDLGAAPAARHPCPKNRVTWLSGIDEKENRVRSTFVNFKRLDLFTNVSDVSDMP